MTSVVLRTSAGETGSQGPAFVAFVTLAGEQEVRVRFRRSLASPQWKCDQHGRHRFATCTHEKAALRSYRNRSSTDE